MLFPQDWSNIAILSSLPGAIGMYGLSLGVQRIAEVLPEIVYAFLSGLNASTVGIITFAAVQVYIHILPFIILLTAGYS